jgi:hypothetical protein
LKESSLAVSIQPIEKYEEIIIFMSLLPKNGAISVPS